MNDYSLQEFLLKENESKDMELKEMVEKRTIGDCERQVRIIFARLGIMKNVVFDNGKPRLA